MARSIAYAAVGALLLGAAPAAACMPAPPTVMFQNGSARLHSDARREIAFVAREFRANPGRRLRLVARTDLVGPADANLRLSRRRGEAVKAALVRRGIPAGAIEIQALGESFSYGTRFGSERNDGLRSVVVEIDDSRSTC